MEGLGLEGLELEGVGLEGVGLEGASLECLGSTVRVLGLESLGSGFAV